MIKLLPDFRKGLCKNISVTKAFPLLLLLAFLFTAGIIRGQVSTYVWSQSQQTYTAGVSTASAVPAAIFPTFWDDNTYTTYKFPFNFTYNGVLYTGGTSTIGVDTDGWVAFSTTGTINMTGTYGGGSWVAAGNTQGVYLNGNANNNGFCGFNSDVEEQVFATFNAAGTNGSPVLTAISDFTNIRVGVRLSGTGIPDGTVVNFINAAAQTITMSANATATGTTSVTPRTSIYAFIRGIAPYRQFVIQWSRASRYNVTTGDDFSFQLVLNEGGANPVYQTLQAVYGTLTSTNASAQNAQVGLRGNTAADFNARTITGSNNWLSTIAAGANTNVCKVTPTVFPPGGLTFTWSRPCSAAASNAGTVTGNNPVCPNSTQIYSIAGVPGAIFYNWTYTGGGTTLSGTTTLPTNTLVFSTGATGGTLTVTPGNLCGNGASSALNISVTAGISATISYPSPSYCVSTTGTVSPTLTGSAGGVYSASPSGLSITSAGIITPGASTAGNYTVTYTYPSGGCSLTASTAVTIVANPTVSVSATPSIVCVGGNSQLQAVGEASGNYTVSSIAYNLLTPVDPTPIFEGDAADDETGSPAIALPFNFTFYGQNITQFYAFPNGYIQLLNTASTASSLIPQTIPNPATPNSIIALAWDDLVVDTFVAPGANVQYFVTGIAPNQVFVIEYTKVSFWGFPNTGNVTGQIRLYENDNHIEIALATVNDAGLLSSKTLGLENALGTVGVSPSGRNNAAWNVSSEAWAFYPKPVSYLWTPATFLNSTSIKNPLASGITANTTYNVKVTDITSGCFATAGTTITIGAPLNGTYTVGPGGNYTTLTAAVYDYNNLCITGNIIFSLTGSAYSTATGETFPITINSNAYASATKTLTIKPASGNSPTITGKQGKALIKLNGADYIIIDGSNITGGTSRNLTLNNTSPNKKSSIIWLNSVTTNGATNNIIKNSIFTGNTSVTTGFLIVSSGATIGNIASAANSKNTYLNNVFTRAQRAIALIGPAGNDANALISGNAIGSAMAANKMGLSGIELYQQANCKVSGNTIAGVTTSTTFTSSGIYVDGTASGIAIDANKISDIKNTNSTGFGCNGIYLASTSAASNITVSNNFISDIAAKGYTLRGESDNGYGIVIDGGAGYNINFNTVVLNTSQASSGYPAALNITSNVTANGAIGIRNNILMNTQTQAGEHYAIQSSAPNTRFSVIDYNDYYITSGNLGYLGSNRVNLPAIVTGFGGNVNSRNILPVFISATDFHMSATGNPSLTNLGIPVTGITTDHDSTTRNGLTPDIGADEWLLPNTGSWVGKTSIDWLVPTNWETNTIPNGTTDVTITGGYVNMPTIITPQAINALNISAPGTPPVLTINGGVLQINGLINRSGGTIEGSNGTVEMNRTAGIQSIPAGLFTNNNLKNLVIGNTNTATGVSLLGTLDIYRSLTFSAAGKKLTTGGFLTFKSTATETAWLGNVTGKMIVGDARVERFIPTGINHGKSWQLLAVPVSGTQSVKASWQENNNPTVIGIAGYGTTLSSEKPGATGRGYDFVTTPGPSIKTYNPLTNAFVSIDNGSTNTSALPIENQKGYMVLVRGDRSVQTSSATATPTTLRTFGRLFTATTGELPPVTTVLPNKFATVGNPYASAIDFTAITKSAGVDNVFYLWDPLLAGSNLLGGYQTISSVAGYLPTPGSTNYPSTIPVTRIQSGQAFYVHGTAGGTVSFTENAKATGSSLVLKPGDVFSLSRQFLRANLYKISTLHLGQVDGNNVAFEGGFSNESDHLDALKIPNTGESFSVRNNNGLFAVEAKRPVRETDTIFYNISGMRPEAYQFRFGPVNMAFSGHTAFLIDKFLETSTRVSLTDSSFIDFNITSDARSSAPDRFYVVFKQLEIVPVTITHIAAARVADQGINVNWKVENELNVGSYEIERSNTGRNFIKIAAALPKLNNGGSTGYEHLDPNPLPGDNYYRIVAKAAEGRLQYSAVVKVSPLKTLKSISVYPNPVADKTLSVSFNNMPEGEYQLRLINKTGQVVFTKAVRVTSSIESKSLPLGKAMASGNYQLSVTATDGTVETLQVLVE